MFTLKFFTWHCCCYCCHFNLLAFRLGSCATHQPTTTPPPTHTHTHCLAIFGNQLAQHNIRHFGNAIKPTINTFSTLNFQTNFQQSSSTHIHTYTYNTYAQNVLYNVMMKMLFTALTKATIRMPVGSKVSVSHCFHLGRGPSGG